MDIVQRQISVKCIEPTSDDSRWLRMDNVLRRELHKIWTKFSTFQRTLSYLLFLTKGNVMLTEYSLLRLELYYLDFCLISLSSQWNGSFPQDALFIRHKVVIPLYIIVIIFLCNLDMLYIGKQSLCDLSLTEETVVIIFVSLSFLKQMT